MRNFDGISKVNLFIWKGKGPRIALIILKKSKEGKLTLPNREVKDKATHKCTVPYWYKNR